MAQVRSRPKKGPLKPVASVADGVLTDSSANVADTPKSSILVFGGTRILGNLQVCVMSTSAYSSPPQVHQPSGQVVVTHSNF